MEIPQEQGVYQPPLQYHWIWEAQKIFGQQSRTKYTEGWKSWEYHF